MLKIDLSPLESWRLREVTRSAVGRVALRALMVLWRAEGLTTLEIGQRLGCHRETVGHWLERYQTLGIPGLHDESRPGRPRHLDAGTCEQLEAVLEQPPPEVDRPHACWTLAHLRTVFLPVAPKCFCLDTLRHYVHDLGFRWRRPRLWARKEDPDTFAKVLLVETAKRHAATLAAAQPEGTTPPVHFLYADASDHHLLAVIRSMWMRRGQQARVATPPSNGRWTLFGGLDVLTGAFHWQAFEKAVSATFLGFLDYLLTCYTEGTILLVVDNAAYHTSKAVVAWLKEHPRIMLLYLPARRPDLNPVEPIWRALKQAVSANRSFANLLALGQFIRAHFDSLPPEAHLAQAGVRKLFPEAT